jgi:NADH dehydrogenase
MKRIVIIGAGFGGLAAAKALRHAKAEIWVIDRANHNLFQPLLYQVATTVLSPAQIASPIRELLKNQRNATVFLGEVTGINKDANFVYVSNEDHKDAPIRYDILIVATGVTHSYFGHDEFAKFAPGLKGLADALHIRNKVLQAFEQAEAEEDPRRHQDLLTFVLVGAGPTGVELSAALAMLVRSMLKTEFRRIDPAIARVVLVDMAPRVLGTFAAELSEAAKHRLEKLGVEVRLGHSVDQIDADGVVVGGERIASNAVIWTAGVAPSPAGEWLNAETDHTGRVRIQDDLTVPGCPDIYVIGDTASIQQDGKPLPGVAQVAIQQGQYAGRRIAERLLGQPSSKPFRYFDKGNMAVIGAGFAVLQTGRVRLSGLPAWLAWAGIHLQFLATSGLRLSVLLQWIWSFVTRQTGVQLIVNHIPLFRPNQNIELPIPNAGRK